MFYRLIQMANKKSHYKGCVKHSYLLMKLELPPTGEEVKSLNLYE